MYPVSLPAVVLLSGGVVSAAGVSPGVVPVAPEAASMAAPAAGEVTVYRAKAGNRYASIRIPVLLAVKGGRLLAFAEGRKVPGDQGMNDILLRRSDDGGKTWSALATIADSGRDTYNNACPVYDPATGRVLVLFQRYPAGVTERNGRARPGLAAAPDTVSNHVIVSDDLGLTWSAPADITATTKGAAVTLFAGGPNAGLALTRGPHAGRLVVPYNESAGFGHWDAYAVYSDDHGATWKRGAPTPPPHGRVNETALAETADGGLYLNARKWGGAARRKVARSADGGASWSAVADEPALVCTGTQGALLRYAFADDPAGGGSRLLYSGPTRGRTAGRVFLSADDGRTWPLSQSVVPGAFAYSSMARLPDGRVGLLYEPAGDREIRYRTFGLDGFTAVTPVAAD